jgi:hypothetical protein
MMTFTMSARTLLVAGAGLLLANTIAVAQTTVRVRGTIEQIDGQTLSIKSKEGPMLKVVLADNAVILGVVKRSLDDIKQGEFVGTAATSQGDGTWKALEVHIFPENMRGTGEGHRDWDAPQSSMTNATVTDKVVKMDGHTMTLTYKGGEQKILVTPQTPVVAYAPGSRDDLKPGNAIFIAAATKAADGSLSAARVSVQRDAAPPM